MNKPKIVLSRSLKVKSVMSMKMSEMSEMTNGNKAENLTERLHSSKSSNSRPNSSCVCKEKCTERLHSSNSCHIEQKGEIN
jgi:hypothetical protein